MAVAIRTQGPTRILKPRDRAAPQDVTTHQEQERREASLCTGEGERLGLYDIIGERGPVTVFDLALEARIPVSLALRWLASQTQSGHVARDVVTGRYRTWCVLPEPAQRTS